VESRTHAARPPGAARRKPKRLPATAPEPEIEHALDYIRQQIATGKLRPTINDLVRLLDIRQRQQPSETVACWYHPNAPEGTCPVCLRPSDPAATARFRAILDRQRLGAAEQEQP